MTWGVFPNDIYHNGQWYSRSGQPSEVLSEIDSVTGVIAFQANGEYFAVPAIVDSGTPTTTVAVGAGSHTSVALSSGYYRVDPDMDVYCKSSDSSANYGANLIGGGKSYRRTAGSLATMTGLDFASASFSIEAWCDLRAADSSNSSFLFEMGINTGGARIQFDLAALNGTVMKPELTLKDNAGGTIVATGLLTPAPSIPLGTDLRHVVATVNRTTGASAAYVTFYIDGSQVAQYNYTDAGVALNISSVTSGSAILAIGRAFGVDGLWNGRIEDIKFYSTLLTLAQVQARNAIGPVRSAPLTSPIDSADLYCTWWLSFQSGAATPACETGYGNATLDSSTGSPSVDLRTSGAAANTLTSNRVNARQPELIYHSGTYLALYSGASGGNVRLTAV